MTIKKHIPNAITCCNLLCGCLAIVQAFEGNLVYSAYLVGLGAIFDFFDGFAARMLKVSSPIGKDLDSLTDMVTFGVVPGIVVFQLYQFSMMNYVERCHGDEMPPYFVFLKYSAFVITIFSAIRLAKFNNDTRQTDSFIGLATPANSMIVCGFCLVLKQLDLNLFDIESVIENEQLFADNGNITGMVVMYLLNSPIALCLISIGLSLLLVVELPLFALKFKNFRWTDNKLRYIFLGICLILMVSFKFVGIPLIIFLYILLSIVDNIFLKKKV